MTVFNIRLWWRNSGAVLRTAMGFAVVAALAMILDWVEPGIKLRIAGSFVLLLSFALILVRFGYWLVLSPEQHRQRHEDEEFFNAFEVDIPRGPKATPEDWKMVTNVVTRILRRKAFVMKSLYDARVEASRRGDNEAAVRIEGDIAAEKRNPHGFQKLEALAHRRRIPTFFEPEPYTKGLVPPGEAPISHQT